MPTLTVSEHIPAEKHALALLAHRTHVREDRISRHWFAAAEEVEFRPLGAPRRAATALERREKRLAVIVQRLRHRLDAYEAELGCYVEQAVYETR